MILAGISLALAVMSAVALLRHNPELESYDATAYDCERAARGVRRVADGPVQAAWFGDVSPAVDAGRVVAAAMAADRSRIVRAALAGLRGALEPIRPLRFERVAA